MRAGPLPAQYIVRVAQRAVGERQAAAADAAIEMVAQHRQPIANVSQFVDAVGNKYDADAFGLQAAHHVKQALALGVIERGGRFVEHQKTAAVRQRARQQHLLFFRQRPSPNLLPAALLGLTGIVALFWQDLAATRMAPELLKGIGLSALGTYGFSLGNMISTRHQRRGLDIFSTNTYAMTYGALLMALIALAQGASFQIEFSSRYIGSLLYLAIFGSVIAFAAYFSLLGRIGASAAAYSTLLFPLVALTISTIYEGYQWHFNAVLGLCLILLGNLVMFAKPGLKWRRPGIAKQSPTL
mgnify:CR=1 FL=1